MSNQNFDEIALQSRSMAYDGKDYEEIIKNIPINQLNPDEQKSMRSLVNDFIVQYNLSEQVKYRYKTQIMLGGVALLLGIFILLFAQARGESALGLGLAVSLIGLYVIKKGYNKYKEPLDFQHIAPEKDSKFRKY